MISIQNALQQTQVWSSFFPMALLLGMMNGRKHGHQHPPIKKQEPICWLEKWLHEDMGDIVQILFLSYDSYLVGVHNNVANISKNLIHSLVK
jgi:hypothetical protein